MYPVYIQEFYLSVSKQVSAYTAINRLSTRIKRFKRTYERWGLMEGEGKLRIETSGGE
jgi:hypothetical protein